MSVRTEPRELSAQLQQTLTITPESMLAAAAANPATGAAAAAVAPEAQQQINEQHLNAANDFNTNSPEHPLHRTVCINIRASLSDLCLKAGNSVWQPPSAEATRNIFQQAPTLIL